MTTTTDFRIRDVALVAYGPTVVNSIGHGAVAPLIALQARALGADVPTAATVVALLGLGMLLGSLPAGALIARIGERRTLMIVGFVDALAMLAAAVTPTLWGLSVAIVVSGLSWSAFLLARQGFMIDAVPKELMARAMAGLGGSHRVGLFVGPLLGAAVVHFFGLASVFVLAAVMSAASALMARLMPDLGRDGREVAQSTGHLSVVSVLGTHRRTLLTLGSVVLLIGACRAFRTSLFPLWADHIGMSATHTSLVFAAAAFVDIAFVYPGGWLMDTYGRMVVALPVVVAGALSLLLLPLATSATTMTCVMVLMAAGNGLSSGINMTLGADVAPAEGRAQFLGGWRLMGDIGISGGPLLVSAIAAVASLGVVAVSLGVLMTLATGWVGWWTRQVDLRRRAATPEVNRS
ncbi:MFS transporter [Nocardioides jishulii]|uniref:MFS transporter n=1 Tax=Nocardioides jishulii TaxID=2575440 RepID=A0A4V5TKJ3_9ACTN|nr:MFS transporter [Nocardioides jishulii]QCX26352.1 MFS transporter [Nocardioides jishulii]TKI63843.1 MFS transporter [Nocardioides jishulii]